MSGLSVIQGGKDNPGFICPWCGYKGQTRDDLEAHWASPKGKQCSRNRAVNSPMQAKYEVNPEPSGE